MLVDKTLKLEKKTLLLSNSLIAIKVVVYLTDITEWHACCVLS